MNFIDRQLYEMKKALAQPRLASEPFPLFWPIYRAEDAGTREQSLGVPFLGGKAPAFTLESLTATCPSSLPSSSPSKVCEDESPSYSLGYVNGGQPCDPTQAIVERLAPSFSI